MESPDLRRHLNDKIFQLEMTKKECAVFLGIQPTSLYDWLHGGREQLTPLIRHRMSEKGWLSSPEPMYDSFETWRDSLTDREKEQLRAMYNLLKPPSYDNYLKIMYEELYPYAK